MQTTWSQNPAGLHRRSVHNGRGAQLPRGFIHATPPVIAMRVHADRHECGAGLSARAMATAIRSRVRRHSSATSEVRVEWACLRRRSPEKVFAPRTDVADLWRCRSSPAATPVGAMPDGAILQQVVGYAARRPVASDIRRRTARQLRRAERPDIPSLIIASTWAVSSRSLRSAVRDDEDCRFDRHLAAEARDD